MNYYNRMFRAFSRTAIIYTLLIELVFLVLYWIPSRHAFTENVAATARQLSDFTDIRLQSPQEIGLMLGVSEYTRKYLGEYLTNYEKLKYFSFINGISGINSSQSHAIAVTKYTDDYVILNNRTGNLDFFRSEFFMNEALLNTIISRFNENRSELVQVHTVKDVDQKDLYIIARQEWFGATNPIYIFTAFYENQLFCLNTLTKQGTFAVYYGNQLVASSGSLDRDQISALLAKGASQKDKVVFNQASGVSGFHYVYITEPQPIITPVLVMIIALGLLAIVVSLGIMTLITKRMYNPIQGVLRTTGDPITSGDEFVHIESTLHSLHTNVQTMSASLEQYKVSLESKKLTDLLIGLVPPDRVNEELRRYPHLVKGPFVTVLFKYTKTVPYSGELSSDLTQDTKQLLSRTLEAQYSWLYRMIDLNFETKVLLLQTDDLEQLSERLRNTIINIEPEYGLEITAIISRASDTLADLPANFRQSLKISEMPGYLTSNAKVIRAEDEAEKPTWKGAAYYPLQSEQTLVHAIVQGKTSIWQSALEDIIRTNQSERGGSTLPILTQMLETTVTRIIDSSGGQSLVLFGQREPLDLPFRSCRTYEELHQAALDTFGALDHWFAQEHEKLNNGLAEKMLSYIHEHYQKDISLFNLADYLNLSRNYVSTLFKNTVGRNFKDYLGEFRHQMACKLMEEQPKKKIKEIAELVGCNTEILTRLFVRYSGMPPSDYRQRLGQNGGVMANRVGS